MGKGARVADEEKNGLRQHMGTPRGLFAGLHNEFQFTVDACAVPENAKLTAFWSPEHNGLAQDWVPHRPFVNPPWNDIYPWMRKGWDAVRNGCERVVYLLPTRTGTDWWRDYAIRSQIDYFRERVQFEFPEELVKKYETQGKKAGSGGNDTDCALIVMERAYIELGDGDEIPTYSGFRDRETGQRLILKCPPTQLELAPTVLHSVPAVFPKCLVCGERNGSAKDWSTMVNGPAHRDCLEKIRNATEGMPDEQRREIYASVLANAKLVAEAA